MRSIIDLVESAGSPAELFIQYVEQRKPVGTTAELQAGDTPDEVIVSWIEGRGLSLVDFICEAADHFGVTLVLVVDIYGHNDGGKLVPHYQSKGFRVTASTSGETLNDVGEFDLDLIDHGFDHDEVHMERTPRQQIEEKWTERYRERDFWEVIRDFEKAGGSWAGGQFGTVFIHPRWSFVYKVFNDASYLTFARWASRNPHPCLPRFLSKPKRVVPFYKRPRRHDTVYVVKLEKLKEWDAPREELKQMGGLEYVLEHVAMSAAAYNSDTPPESLTGVHLQRWERTKQFLARYPEIKALADFYPILMAAPIEASPDIHVGNVMQRDDGTLVFTDPFWHGETPYSLAAKAQQAETDYEYDDEADQILGGERYRRPKPRKPRKPSKPVSWGSSDDDLPF
jgi:hypothetical protein